MNSNWLIRVFNQARKIPRTNEHLSRFLRHAPRCMSTNASISQIAKDKETFQDVLPSILENLISSPKFAQVPEMGSWIKQVLDYNLAGGKTTRGIATVFAYEMLEKPENVTEESMRKARIAGWCVEMLQAYLIMIDDIMDGSTTRRGMPCWYRLPNVGLGALNDSILVYCSIYETLHSHFSNTRHYTKLLDIFNEALLYTSIGQHLDYTMAHRTKSDYSLFTIERYSSIVKHKTSYYTFKLPVFLGLLLAKDVDKDSQKDVEKICFELGQLFQIQDDYIDCFGDEVLTGKAGTDIQEGKCSWLAVTALQHCNEAQKSLFVESYGSKEPSDVKRIKQIYEELQLPQLYQQQEHKLYNGIVMRIQALPTDISKALFFKILELTYKRKH